MRVSKCTDTENTFVWKWFLWIHIWLWEEDILETLLDNELLLDND